MNDTIFSVSDASRLAEVKSHVLRYWEEEMNLPINRNEMGHRYYTQLDIQVFLSIKELKKKGLSLKEIGEIALLIYGVTVRDEPREEEETFVIPEQFYAVLEKLVAAKQREEKGEETRYKKLDQAIRHHQQSRKQIAATQESDRKRRKIGKRKENKNT